MNELARDFSGKAVIGRVYDREKSLFQTFSIRALPTIIVVRDGEVKMFGIGGRQKEVLAQAIQRYVP